MKVPMSGLLSKMANFTLPKLPQLQSTKVVYLSEDQSNSKQLRFRDEGIPPGEGMFSVFFLNGVQVLVKYIKKLPYDPKLIGLDGNGYKFVQPLPSPSDVKEGEIYTMFVGSSHFLVQIMQILSTATPPNRSINKPGMGFAVFRKPTGSSGEPSAIVPVAVEESATNDDIPPKRSEPEPVLNHRIKRVPVPPFSLQIPFTTTVTTTVDPIPTSKPYHHFRNSSLPFVNSADDVVPQNPRSQSPPTTHRGRSFSEPTIAQTAPRNSTDQGVTNTSSPLLTSRRVSAPLGSSPLRNEVTLQVDSDSPPPPPSAQLEAPSRNPSKIEGLNLRNFPGPLTPSPLEDEEDKWNAQREAVVGMKPASPVSPSVRTGGSGGKKSSNHSRSKSLVAVPSTRTPNPRPHVPLSPTGQRSPSRSNHLSEKTPGGPHRDKVSKASSTNRADGTGSSQRPIGLGLDTKGTNHAKPIEVVEAPEPLRHSHRHRRADSFVTRPR